MFSTQQLQIKRIFFAHLQQKLPGVTNWWQCGHRTF
nr:MAG TPA: hypothetical protein [Caudoviricetes sp.]